MASCYHPINRFIESSGHAYLLPCGRCSACLERKRQGWILRAQYAMNEYRYAYFITLSYSDEFLPYEYFTQKKKGVAVSPISTGESVLCPYDLRLFFERFRIASKAKFGYFACGEYGDVKNTHRPHYHICLFTDLNWIDCSRFVRLAWSFLRPETAAERYQRYKRSKLCGCCIKRDSQDMRNRISIGRDQVRCLTYKRISYVAKYVTKQISSNEIIPTFYRASKGLGKSFLDTDLCKSLSSQNIHFTYLQSGLPCSIPRYYSRYMFTKEQNDSFSLDMVIRETPYLPEDFSSEEDFYECCKAYYKLSRAKAESSRRKKNLLFQGVRLLC